MEARFEGLSDSEWKLFEYILPKEPEKKVRGITHAPFQYILNTLLYILITECCWCMLPLEKFGHQKLQRTDGNNLGKQTELWKIYRLVSINYIKLYLRFDKNYVKLLVILLKLY
ncbi:transposase [Nostoc sp. CENA543]|uniref:transposase n=1 Tax=Nostoc sp. CENA543 TaxID=1869241 RepID=UPI0026A22775